MCICKSTKKHQLSEPSSHQRSTAQGDLQTSAALHSCHTASITMTERLGPARRILPDGLHLPVCADPVLDLCWVYSGETSTDSDVWIFLFLLEFCEKTGATVGESISLSLSSFIKQSCYHGNHSSSADAVVWTVLSPQVFLVWNGLQIQKKSSTRKRWLTSWIS